MKLAATILAALALAGCANKRPSYSDPAHFGSIEKSNTQARDSVRGARSDNKAVLFGLRDRRSLNTIDAKIIRLLEGQ